MGLRTRSVSLMNSCGLALMNICWVGRIIIMRVGCMARTRVALNMVAVCLRKVVEWRVVERRELGVSSQERWGSWPSPQQAVRKWPSR
jgi:hypothetical protein